VRSGDSRNPTGYDIAEGFCPECSHFLVLLRKGRVYEGDFNDEGTRELMAESVDCIYPPTRDRRPQPPEVPDPYKSNFAEAVAILHLSAKASAAISRRILQHILRDEFHIKRRSLADEIVAFVAMPNIPSHLADAVDAVRTVGNLAAHPTKDAQTGEVLEVEPGEAEWLIEVLELLFDFTFVQPKRLADRKTALNAKLAAAGKPPIK
jgi:hypothetical protein